MGKKKKRAEPAKKGRVVMTVSVPPDVRRRMDEAAKRHEINWSAVAVQAFERRLGELLQHKKEVDMTEVVARLKAQETQESSPLYQRGQDYGESWAKVTAEPYQLRRLGKYIHEIRAEPANWIDDPFAFEQLYCATEGTNDLADMMEFWEIVFGDDRRELVGDADAMAGFVEGVYDVYWEVKDEMGW